MIQHKEEEVVVFWWWIHVPDVLSTIICSNSITLGNFVDFGDLLMQECITKHWFIIINKRFGMWWWHIQLQMIIEFVTIATTSNATDFGDLTLI